WPIVKLKSTSICCWTFRIRPERDSVENPFISTLSVYLPILTGVKRYSPVALVMASCVVLVPTLSNVTFAPAMEAPLLSVTVPEMMPESWANPTETHATSRIRTDSILTRYLLHDAAVSGLWSHGILGREYPQNEHSLVGSGNFLTALVPYPEFGT